MIDIKKIPLYYISFKPNSEAEKNYSDNGFTLIKHFPAVDGRKMSLKKLMTENIISIRSYNDILNGRREHSGLPSMGAIGCTLSHYELWNLCIKQNWPFIIICEEDNRFTNLTSKKIIDIQRIINKDRGMFVSSSIRQQKGKIHFFGTHCCIISQKACKVLIDNCFPIDAQTDWYIANLASQKKINLGGFRISKQKGFNTSIQDMCVMCWLPRNELFYIVIIVAVIILIITFFVVKHKYKKCQFLGKYSQ